MFNVVTDDVSRRKSSFGANAERASSGLQVDTEQVESFEKIRELLVAGGYFRAMIKTLEPFDKIAGGLAWCITASNVSVDFALLFEEHSRMGEKITMSENIERALVQMKCPYPLQAQQIYALDCINIFPVARWLVSKVIEVRKETGDVLRQYSEAQFRSYNFSLPEEKEAEAKTAQGVEYLRSIEQRYQAKRIYRHKGRGLVPRSMRTRDQEEERVHTVLLEYGQQHLYTMALLQKKGKPDRTGIKFPGGKHDEDAEKESDALRAEKRAKELLSDMSAQDNTARAVIDRGALAQLLKARQEDVKEAISSANQEAQEAERLQAEADEKEKGEFHHARYLQELDKREQQARKRHDEILTAYKAKKAEAQALEEELRNKVEYNERIVSEMAKLNAQIEQSPENVKNMKILKELVSLNENLKKQIAEFRESCKMEREEWQERVATVKAGGEGGEEAERAELVVKTFESDSEKIEKMRERVALKSREVAMLKRKIDSVPSRRELQQYQRQFVEVYEQMAVKYMETKKYYNGFNSAEAIRAALEHEVKLLTSIHDNYPHVRGNKKAAEKFLISLREIVAGMEKRLEAQKKTLDAEVAKRNASDEQYVALVEKEREFYEMTREFQEECAKSELLEAKVSKLKHRKGKR